MSNPLIANKNCTKCRFAEFRLEAQSYYCFFNPPMTQIWPSQDPTGRLVPQKVLVYPEVNKEAWCHQFKPKLEQMT